MRMTFKVATAGENGITQFPMISHPGEWYCDGSGVLDESKARQDLGSIDGIQFSNKDNRATIAFAIEFLDRVRLSYNQFAKQSDGELAIVDIESKSRKTTCERRLASGKVAYVRVDVSISNGSIRVSLSYSNPKNTVGETENFASIVATTFADILIAERDDIAEENGTNVTLVEGDGCIGLFSRREEKERMRHLLVEHKDCDSRINGYCSPVCPSCPLYENGGKCSYYKHAG